MYIKMCLTSKQFTRSISYIDCSMHTGIEQSNPPEEPGFTVFFTVSLQGGHDGQCTYNPSTWALENLRQEDHELKTILSDTQNRKEKKKKEGRKGGREGEERRGEERRGEERRGEERRGESEHYAVGFEGRGKVQKPRNISSPRSWRGKTHALEPLECGTPSPLILALKFYFRLLNSRTIKW